MSPYSVTAVLQFIPALLLVLSSNLPLTLAQSQLVTWSTVTLIYHGEKTPALSPTATSYDLTPLGAQQLYSAGQVLASRYINGDSSASAHVVNGMSRSIIDNSQIYILSLDDTFQIASALAALQGMYPPVFEINEESILSNGSQLSYPLNGYQYPALNTANLLDYNYLWIGGQMGCTAYEISNGYYVISQAYFDEIEQTANFYNSLNDTVFWNISEEYLNYGNAYDLYEYALYEANHNTTLYNSSSFTTSQLAQLESLASQQQWQFNTPSAGTTVGAIAAQTLASKILQQFSSNIASSGVTDKMTLLFSDFEPFLSFFALSGLSTGPSASRFNSLPQHGSMLTFELYSYVPELASQNLSTPFPSQDELWVNFYYSNGTSATGSGEGFVNYSLFGRGNSEAAMSWTDFVQGLGTFSMNDILDWCNECNAVTMFCEAIKPNTVVSNSTTVASPSKSGISAPIAGVIGATVTIATFILVAGVLMLFGFRIDYHDRNSRGGASSNTGNLGVLKRSGSGQNGGFKGAEKLASDTDLRLKNGGAGASVVRHERVGSWELHESPVSPTGTTHESLDKQLESGRLGSTADYSRRSMDLDHEHPDHFGDPVKALDQV